MAQFRIYAGLGGVFGGAEEQGVYEYADVDQANEDAYYMACEQYDNMAGLHGLRDLDQIMEEEGVDADEAEEIYREDQESWIDYWVVEVTA